MDNVDNHLVHVDVTSISRWIYGQVNENNEIDVREMGDLLLPPFDKFYIHWVVDGMVFTANALCTHKDDNYYKLAMSRFKNDATIDRDLVENFLLLFVDIGPYKDVISVQYFFDENRNPLINGRCVVHTNKELESEVGSHVFHSLAHEVDCIYRRTTALMYCKNIELKDEPLSRQQRRRKERKNEIIYKVLAIKEGSKSTRYLDHGHSGDKHAYHLCRGHFKTYTDDAPLFGRLTGTYWWPAHVRGSKEFGEVVKDYQVG